jgi:hypothetical protein
MGKDLLYVCIVLPCDSLISHLVAIQGFIETLSQYRSYYFFILPIYSLISILLHKRSLLFLEVDLFGFTLFISAL